MGVLRSMEKDDIRWIKQYQFAVNAEVEGLRMILDGESRLESAACHYESAGRLDDAERLSTLASKLREARIKRA